MSEKLEFDTDMELDLDSIEVQPNGSDDEIIKVTIETFLKTAETYFGKVGKVKGFVTGRKNNTVYVLLVCSSKKKGEQPHKLMHMWTYSTKTNTASPTSKSIRFLDEYADTISDMILDECDV